LHHEAIELDQEVLRRRLRAARILADVTVEQLAERVTPGSRLSQRTLHKLEQGDTPLTAPIMRELAAALDLPYEWFTVPSIGQALAPPDLPRQVSEMRDALEALQADHERLWDLASHSDRPGSGQRTPPREAARTGAAARPRSPRRSSRP
jgi:transcriptional regulator with XRE-family HTH domain